MFATSMGINFNEAYSMDTFFSVLFSLTNKEPSPRISRMRIKYQKQFDQNIQYSLYYIAKTFKTIGKLKRALEVCKECLELNPRFEKALKLQNELLKDGIHS